MNLSVICPVFNSAPAHLRDAVQSVLSQAGQHEVELIMVDDCSTDAATLTALTTFEQSDSPVRVIHRARNAGPGAARMAGIAEACHQWIGFIDSDDLWPSNKLMLADAVLRERPDARWITGNYATLAPDGSLHTSKHLSTVVPASQLGHAASRMTSPALTRGLIGNWLPLGASIVQSDLIHAAGGFDPRLIYGEDWLLSLRMSVLAEMDHTDTETYILRRQGISMMRSAGRMSSLLARSSRLARRDASLRLIRRELRWHHYATFKDIAMNNALNGRKLKGFLYACRALLIDPREMKDFALFISNLPARGPALAQALRRYSMAEQVVSAQLAAAEHARDS